MKRRFLLVTAALGATTVATALSGCPRVYANPKGAHYDAGSGSGSGAGSATPDAGAVAADGVPDSGTK